MHLFILNNILTLIVKRNYINYNKKDDILTVLSFIFIFIILLLANKMVHNQPIPVVS